MQAKFPRKSAAYHFQLFIVIVIVLPTATGKLQTPPSVSLFLIPVNLQLSVSMAGIEPKAETNGPPPATTPKSMVKIKTVKVSNMSLAVTEKDIWEFFSFSGEIHYIEMKSGSETTKHAFVTFKDSKGADTAVLLTGATIADLAVQVTPVENYQLPPQAPPLTADETQAPATDSDKTSEVVQKAEDVVSTMLAKGFVLGKDALKKAKSFDEKHQLTNNASTTYANLDRKMGLTKNLSMGRAVVNEKMKEVDERYQVSEATKSAFAVAEQKATTAGNALMKNHYVSSGVLMVSNALSAFAKAAEGVGSKTKEKLDKAQEEKEEVQNKKANTVNDVEESKIKDSPMMPPAMSSVNPAMSLVNPATSSDNPVQSSDNPAKSSDNNNLPNH